MKYEIFQMCFLQLCWRVNIQFLILNVRKQRCLKHLEFLIQFPYYGKFFAAASGAPMLQIKNGWRHSQNAEVVAIFFLNIKNERVNVYLSKVSSAQYSY